MYETESIPLFYIEKKGNFESGTELCSKHRRQEPFCVDHKTYAKLSAFVKYVIKFVGGANPITNFEFAKEYAKNNKRNTYLIFIVLPYPIPNLDYVSHTRFNCVVIAKPFRYLNYEEDNTIKPCVAYIV
jgi:hypothetical protein